MFEGFNEATIKYYQAIRKENSKSVHKENEFLYLEGIKKPLEEMYFELEHYFSGIDVSLLSSKRRCLSSAYQDARFCRETPIKEYFYIRFKLDRSDKKNKPGFFFDASLDGYKYGLSIYDMDAGGMEKIRYHILDNKNSAKKVIENFNAAGLLHVQGEPYKRAHYQEEDAVLRDWLERKRISFLREGELGRSFFEREILNRMMAAFDSVKDVYFMLKEAL